MEVTGETVAGWLFFMNLVTSAFGVYVAAEKNRGPIAWGILCFFFGLVALVALAGIPTVSDEEAQAIEKARDERIRLDAVAWTDPLGPPPGRGND